MTQGLFTLEEVSSKIRAGEKLLLAGDNKLLSQLPKGNWIGGSTPYFILYPEQMTISFEKIFSYSLPDFIDEIKICEYDSSGIKNVYNEAFQNGFTVLIMPFASPVLMEYALNATYYKNFANYPVCGWVAGQLMDILATKESYVASGVSGHLSDKAVAMHISLPKTKYAEIHTFNPFEQGDGDVITFDNRGFVVKDAIINGVKQNFAEYIRKTKTDARLPLVADYSGAMMNILCFAIKEDKVYLTVPVAEQIEYRFAKRIQNLTDPDITNNDSVIFSISCVSNILNAEICGRNYIKYMNGPAVFGEIAYQLVNQTTVYVTIGDVSPNAETK